MPDRFDIPQLSSIPRPHDHDDESEAIANRFLFDDIVHFPPPESYPRLFRKDGAAAVLNPVGIGDFGSANVRLKPFARAAFDGANVEHGLAHAIGELHDLTESLIADPDFESHAETFERGVKTIADRVAERLPDGDATDSFRERFSLIAEGKAVELRGIDTRRLVARNRKGLDDALARYAKLAGGAPNRLTSEFSVDQAVRAIDREIDNGVISPDEGREIEAAFFRQVEDEAVRQLIDIDPSHAADNLRDTSIYPRLDAARRAQLTELADRRVEQQRFDEETELLRTERAAAAARADAVRAFVAGFDAQLRRGQGKATDIGVAEADGIISRAEADRLLQHLRDDEARRAERIKFGEMAHVAIATGMPLDPANPDDFRAAEIHAADVLGPALVAATRPDEFARVHASIRDLGFLPPSLRRQLDIMWRSGEPNFAAKAAMVLVGPEGAIVESPTRASVTTAGDTAPGSIATIGALLRPGMVEVVALMRAGLPAEQAVPQAMAMAEKANAVGDEAGAEGPTRPATRSGSTTSANGPDGSGANQEDGIDVPGDAAVSQPLASEAVPSALDDLFRSANIADPSDRTSDEAFERQAAEFGHRVGNLVRSNATDITGRKVTDVRIVLRGSAVTGNKYNPATGRYDGARFDDGRVSDFDVAIISPSLLEKAKSIGIELRNGRTKVLSAKDMERLGINALPSQHSSPKGPREMTYMIYESVEALIDRGPFIILD